MDMLDRVELEGVPIPAINGSTQRRTMAPPSPVKPQTTKEFLINQIDRWKESDKDENFCGLLDMWDALKNIVETLYEHGFMPDDDKFHLCHLDLQAHNILVQAIRDGDVAITDILDWDSLIFGPKFVAMRAPFWLWNDDDRDEQDEYGVLAISQSREQRLVKDMYEEMAGSEALKYAYTTEYIIARRVFYIIQCGIESSTYFAMAEDIIADFQKLYPSSNPMYRRAGVKYRKY